MKGEKNILVKVHNSYRWVVAICDKELYGHILSEGEKQLDLTGEFFNGEEMTDTETKEEIIRCINEDATFNIVGNKAIEIAKEIGIINESGIITIDNIPCALVLV